MNAELRTQNDEVRKVKQFVLECASLSSHSDARVTETSRQGVKREEKSPVRAAQLMNAELRADERKTRRAVIPSGGTGGRELSTPLHIREVTDIVRSA